METLWAPWRLPYITAAKRPSGDDPCFICQGLAEQDDRRNLIVKRTALSVVLLNRFPYNNGHLLVAPRAHKGRLDELGNDELLETMNSLRRMVNLLGEMMHPDGFNVGPNLGTATRAPLPRPLHRHILPPCPRHPN